MLNFNRISYDLPEYETCPVLPVMVNHEKIIAPQAQLFETAKDRSVSTESPFKQVVTASKPDPVLSSNARYEAILVSRSGSPDGRFWPDRVRPSVRASGKITHLLAAAQ